MICLKLRNAFFDQGSLPHEQMAPHSAGHSDRPADVVSFRDRCLPDVGGGLVAVGVVAHDLLPGGGLYPGLALATKKPALLNTQLPVKIILVIQSAIA